LSQKHPDFKDDPVLLHVGDRVRFYEVDDRELVSMEEMVDKGSSEFRYKKTQGNFSVAEWLDYNRKHKGEIEAWHKHQSEAAAKAPVP
jgi:hypothetical protein